MPVKILIVDDHPLVREGLLGLLAAQSDFEVCGEASGLAEARQALATTQPDVVIVDLTLRDGHGIRPPGHGIDKLKAIPNCRDQLPRCRRGDRADVGTDVDLPDTAGCRIEPLDEVARDVDPDQPLLPLEPHGPFADLVVPVRDQLNRQGLQLETGLLPPWNEGPPSTTATVRTVMRHSSSPRSMHRASWIVIASSYIVAEPRMIPLMARNPQPKRAIHLILVPA